MVYMVIGIPLFECPNDFCDEDGILNGLKTKPLEIMGRSED
jgi:hypothetical protein